MLYSNSSFHRKSVLSHWFLIHSLSFRMTWQSVPPWPRPSIRWPIILQPFHRDQSIQTRQRQALFWLNLFNLLCPLLNGKSTFLVHLSRNLDKIRFRFVYQLYSKPICVISYQDWPRSKQQQGIYRFWTGHLLFLRRSKLVDVERHSPSFVLQVVVSFEAIFQEFSFKKLMRCNNGFKILFPWKFCQ